MSWSARGESARNLGRRTMILTNDMYVPAVRWRQAEYQALYRLSSDAKDKIVQLITTQEIEFDFEERRAKKSVQEHVSPFSARYQSKWGGRPSWIGTHATIADATMDDGRDIFTYIFDGLREFE